MMKEIKLLNKINKVIINNSYETDPSSSSTSTSNEILIKGGMNNNNQKTKKTTELSEVKYLNRRVANNINEKNAVINDEEFSLKKKVDLTSSQESDFIGFSKSQLSNKDSEDENYEDSEYYETDEQSGQSETDYGDTSETESEEEYKRKYLPLNREESNQSLKFKICCKVVEGETIYEMFSVENSCNAVDMNVTKVVEKDNRNELTFDGKIKLLKEKNILNDIDNKKSCESNFINNINFKSTDENKLNNNELKDSKIYQTMSTDKETCNIISDIEINQTISVDDKNKTNFVDNKNTTPNIYVSELNKNVLERNVEIVDHFIASKETTKENKIAQSPNTLEHLGNSSVIHNISELSPDLFDDEYSEYDKMLFQNPSNISVTSLSKEQLNNSAELDSVIEKRDRELLFRVERSLSGIPPPPSKTVVDLNLFELISKNKNKILNFGDNLKKEKTDEEEFNDSLFKPTVSFDEMSCINWPNLLRVQYHGISYNVSNASEKVEYLSTSVVDRYIGVETKSSYMSSPSSTKKRNMRLKQLTQSPGSRLSHLAKRRAIFSSANLLSNNQKTSGLSGNRQILLDNSKAKNKRKVMTPRRLTPNHRRKVYGRNTPSSAKKRLLRITEGNQKLVPSRESSKRALFQSPPHQKVFETKAQTVQLQIKPEIASRVEKSKRALFSPDGKFSMTALSQPDLSQKNNLSQISIFGGSSLNLYNQSKRKRDNENSSPCDNHRKLFRLDSSNSLIEEKLTPKSLKIKSQSFCVGSNINRGNSFLNNSTSLPRARSDTTFSSHQLTESHKKKLLWAVSSALQNKQIGVTHPDFKRHASTLAKAIKRLFVEFYKKSTSTSETLLKLSKKYVYCAIQGRSVDYIYLSEKRHIENEKMFNSSKVSGYIAPEQYDNLKTKLPSIPRSSILSFENSMESWNSQVENTSFNSHLLSEESGFSVSNSQIQQQHSAIKLPIQSNKILQNSSTKNNLTEFVLKENILCDVRKSASKNFTGKDQKNISPYKSPYQYSTEKFISKPPLNEYYSSTVKRQISFDY